MYNSMDCKCYKMHIHISKAKAVLIKPKTAQKHLNFGTLARHCSLHISLLC